MEGREQIPVRQRVTQRAFEIGARDFGRAQDRIDAGAADRMDPVFRLAQLPQPVRGLRIGRKVQAGHLADGMAEGIVESAIGHIAAAEMGDGNLLHEGRLRRGEDLVAVAQQQHEIRPQLVEGRGEAGDTLADRLRHGRRVIAFAQRLDPLCDRDSVGGDLIHRHADSVPDACRSLERRL